MAEDLNFDPAADYSTDHPYRRWIGIELTSNNRQNESSVFSEKPLSGPVILRVNPEGPAHKAGIKADDMIVQVNHSPVTSPESFIKFLQERPIGEVVIVGISRGDHILQLKVVIESDPTHQRLREDQSSS
ncbi:MAG: PDZ domain-containing protein [Candidatus Obscuribacterales bacterium]